MAINLSLVSHTNVGKTSLLRTLMREDIGDVADRPHVTEAAEAHVLMQTPEGDVLRLWDTPGLGDSARLLKRLRASDNPIGWVLTQVWDRFTDRPFFSSQQAIRNVREESDVVLYLVNAAEDPASAAYVEMEMLILGWIGKPVVVLLNQMGAARPSDAEAADEATWRAHLRAHRDVRAVLGLDAFARCWVQEDELLGVVAGVLAQDKREAFERLRAAWRRRNVSVFEASMVALAAQLALVLTDREAVREAGFARKAGQWLAGLAASRERSDPEVDRAMEALAKRLDAAVRANTDQLIELHGLSGRASEGVLTRLAGEYRVTKPADVAATGLIGGVVSGALGGLAADLAAGGLTFGAGALIGGIVGALGAGGAARAYNLVRGGDDGTVRWSPEFVSQRFIATLLRYLAVAHYGRGRGDWVAGEYPPRWQRVAEEAVGRVRVQIEALAQAAAEGADAEVLARRIEPVVAQAARQALVRLYPDAQAIFAP